MREYPESLMDTVNRVYEKVMEKPTFDEQLTDADRAFLRRIMVKQ